MKRNEAIEESKFMYGNLFSLVNIALILGFFIISICLPYISDNPTEAGIILSTQLALLLAMWSCMVITILIMYYNDRKKINMQKWDKELTDGK